MPKDNGEVRYPVILSPFREIDTQIISKYPEIFSNPKLQSLNWNTEWCSQHKRIHQIQKASGIIDGVFVTITLNLTDRAFEYYFDDHEPACVFTSLSSFLSSLFEAIRSKSGQ